MPRGRGRGPQMSNEKAKDFKGTMKKLMAYLSAYKIGIFFVIVFAIGSTIFNIVGPKILGKATTEIFKGLVRKVSGGSGIDFDKIAHIVLTLLCLYLTSAVFSFVQGYIMTGVSQKLTYRLRKEISEKINRLPMNYFDKQTHGEVLSRITNDVDTLSQSLNQSATQVITSTTTIIGVLIMMLSISADDRGSTPDPSGFNGTDLSDRETFTEIFHESAGISGSCKRTGGRNLWRS